MLRALDLGNLLLLRLILGGGALRDGVDARRGSQPPAVISRVIFPAAGVRLRSRRPAGHHQTVLSVADGSMRTFQVPEMCSHACLETPCGLVLAVANVSLRCSMWNPQTGEKIALPAMDRALPVLAL